MRAAESERAVMRLTAIACAMSALAFAADRWAFYFPLCTVVAVIPVAVLARRIWREGSLLWVVPTLVQLGVMVPTAVWSVGLIQSEAHWGPDSARAVRAYVADQGKAPASLAALVPKYLPREPNPKSPITGNVGYVRSDDHKWCVYWGAFDWISMDCQPPAGSVAGTPVGATSANPPRR